MCDTCVVDVQCYDLRYCRLYVATDADNAVVGSLCAVDGVCVVDRDINDMVFTCLQVLLLVLV